VSVLSSLKDTKLRVGTVVRAEPFPQARKPALQLWIDFGPLGVKRSSAQITRRYLPGKAGRAGGVAAGEADCAGDPGDPRERRGLVGRQVCAVVNLPPRQVASVRSEVLVLGAVPDADAGTPLDVILLAPDADVPPGTRVA